MKLHLVLLPFLVVAFAYGLVGMWTMNSTTSGEYLRSKGDLDKLCAEIHIRAKRRPKQCGPSVRLW